MNTRSQRDMDLGAFDSLSIRWLGHCLGLCPRPVRLFVYGTPFCMYNAPFLFNSSSSGKPSFLEALAGPVEGLTIRSPLFILVF